MTDLNDIIPGGLPVISPFGPTSRYHDLPLGQITLEGVTHRFVTRRFLPDPDALAGLGEHVVRDGDRPDNLAAQAYGDPELYWRLCDGNRVRFASELTAEVGRRLRITLPAGVPGAPDA